jgi:hypothetical protein
VYYQVLRQLHGAGYSEQKVWNADNWYNVPSDSASIQVQILTLRAVL